MKNKTQPTETQNPVNPVSEELSATQTPPPQLEVTPEVKNNSKMKLIIGGVVFLIMVLIGTSAFFGYKYFQAQKQGVETNNVDQITTETNPSPTPDLTEEWVTYNEFPNYVSFRYPPNWKKEVQEGGIYILAPNQSTKVFTVGWQKTQNSSVKDDLHNYLENISSYGDQGIKYISENEFNVGQQNGWIVEIENTSLNQRDKIFFVKNIHNPETYQGLWAVNITSETNSQVDQILSTFEFIEE